MKHTAPLGFLLGIALLVSPASAEKNWTLPSTFPAGTYIQELREVDASGRRAIGAKLGGDIVALTNAVFSVQGRRIQVNILTAPDEENAEALYRALSSFHTEPFCVQRDLVVVEFTGRGVDEALARKASFELGLVPKPSEVEYSLVARIALVDSLNYGKAQELTEALGSLEVDPSARHTVAALRNELRCGRSLRLRKPDGGTTYRFDPSPIEIVDHGSVWEYRFRDPPQVEGISFVRLRAQFRIGERTSRAEEVSTAPPEPTPYWPSDDPELRSLAATITSGAQDPEEKVAALLQWLAPGGNLRYSGPIGSRWGVKRVLNQRFGRCWDFADCFVTLARALGVPARQVGGWLFGSGGHIWAEYQTTEGRWREVDATGGGILPCGIYHIPYFETDDGAMPIVYVELPSVRILSDD